MIGRCTTEQSLAWLKARLREMRKEMRTPKSRNAVSKAIEELEFRVEKKPVTVNTHMSGLFVPGCPTCENELTDEEYCPVCGQAIDWSDMEEET